MGRENKLYTLTTGAATLAGMVVMAAILLANLAWNAAVDQHEVVTFHTPGLSWLAVSAAVAAAGAFLVSRAGRLRQQRLFRILATVYLLMGLYLIGFTSPEIRDDAASVYYAARAFMRQQFQEFYAPGYLYCYPNQIGLLLYDLPFTFFTYDTRVLFLANLAQILLINWHLWQISRILFPEDPAVHLLTIGLSFLFLPQFFFLKFAYNTIPGLTLLVMGWYWMLRWDAHPEAIGPVLLGAVLLAGSVLLRNNYIIGVIAICLWELARFFKTGRPGALAAAVMPLAFTLGLNGLTRLIITEITGAPTDQGVPSLLWVAMGTDPGEIPRAPGWYNRLTLNVFSQTGYDPAASTRFALAKIQENLSYFLENPGEAWTFFWQKFASTWCEPTFQSIWSGPLVLFGQESYSYCLSSLYDMGLVFDGVYLFCKGTVMVVLIAGAGYCLWRRGSFYEYGMPLLHLTGGALFHLVWETKSQYVYPYVFLLIPVSAAGLAAACHHLSRLWRQRKARAA